MTMNLEQTLISNNIKVVLSLEQGVKGRSNNGEKFPRFPLLILTCMDPRIDVNRIFQLKLGDAIVLRNAGNICTEDVKRSILVAIQQHDIKTVVVLGHADCAMTKLNMEKVKDTLLPMFFNAFWKNQDNPMKGFRRYFKTFVDELKNVEDQVDTIKRISKFPRDVKVFGLFYDHHTGLVFDNDDLKEIRFINDFKEKYDILVSKKIKKYDLAILINPEEVMSPKINNIENDLEQTEKMQSFIDQPTKDLKIEDHNQEKIKPKEKDDFDEEKKYDDFIDDYIKKFDHDLKEIKTPQQVDPKPIPMFKQQIRDRTHTASQIEAEFALKEYKMKVENYLGKYNKQLEERLNQLFEYAKKYDVKLKTLDDVDKLNKSRKGSINIETQPKKSVNTKETQKSDALSMNNSDYEVSKITESARSVNISNSIDNSYLKENVTKYNKIIAQNSGINKDLIQNKVLISFPKIIVPKIYVPKIYFPTNVKKASNNNNKLNKIVIYKGGLKND